MSYRKRLKELGEAYSKAPKERSGGFDLPQGNHMARIYSAKIKDKEDTVGVVFGFQVLQGEFEKKKVTQYLDLTRETDGRFYGLEILKTTLHTCGIKSNDLDNIENDLASCVGLIVKIYAKHKETNGRTYVTYYVQDVIASDDDDDDDFELDEIAEASEEVQEEETSETEEEPEEEDEPEEEEEEEPKPKPKVKKVVAKKKTKKKKVVKKVAPPAEEEEDDDADLEGFLDSLDD